MKTFALAWRNILRNRRRSGLTLGAIGVATSATLLLGGYLAATVRALETDTVRQVGHLQVMVRDALEFGRSQPAHYALRDHDVVLQALRADLVLAPLLAEATPVLQFGGVAGHFASGASTNFAGQGWDPVARRRLLAWDGHGLKLPPGNSYLDEQQSDGGVIGAGLAQLLGLCQALQVSDCKAPQRAIPSAKVVSTAEWSGDLDQLSTRASQAGTAHTGNPTPASLDTDGQQPQVELLAASAGGAPNVVRLRVLRAQRLGQREADAMHVALPLPLAQRLVFGAGDTSVSALVLQLHHTADLDTARQRVQQWLSQHRPDLEVLDYDRVQPSFRQVINMFTTLFRFVAVLMVMVTLFSVSNTLNMAVSERTREIGTLRAIGGLRRRIRGLFMAEGAMLGLLGAITGLVATSALALSVINTGRLTWTPPGRSTSVPIGVDLTGDGLLIPGVLMLFTLIACLSAWWPARRAAALPVVEALRHV